uniref:Putative secreted protein n=1 Tax=Anopheles darlingi TaxID=43151 RepID=A0A2M4D6S9_ANODA
MPSGFSFKGVTSPVSLLILPLFSVSVVIFSSKALDSLIATSSTLELFSGSTFDSSTSLLISSVDLSRETEPLLPTKAFVESNPSEPTSGCSFSLVSLKETLVSFSLEAAMSSNFSSSFDSVMASGFSFFSLVSLKETLLSFSLEAAMSSIFSSSFDSVMPSGFSFSVLSSKTTLSPFSLEVEAVISSLFFPSLLPIMSSESNDFFEFLSTAAPVFASFEFSFCCLASAFFSKGVA